LPVNVIVVGVNMDRRDAWDYWCMEIKSKREKERQRDRAKMKGERSRGETEEERLR
jgi:hypothetical protein